MKQQYIWIINHLVQSSGLALCQVQIIIPNPDSMIYTVQYLLCIAAHALSHLVICMYTISALLHDVLFSPYTDRNALQSADRIK